MTTVYFAQREKAKKVVSNELRAPVNQILLNIGLIGMDARLSDWFLWSIVSVIWLKKVNQGYEFIYSIQANI